MRFGIGPLEAPLARTAADGDYGPALEQAGLAEENGFDSVWVLERHFTADGRCPHGPALAAALAARTSALRIGVIAPLGLTNPLYLAEDMAVLDNIAGGRTEFAARLPEPRECDGYHVPAEGAGERFDEALEATLRAWAARPFRLEGSYYKIPASRPDGSDGPPQLSVTPKPAQLRIPLWFFATDEEQARQAARFGANLLLPPWDHLDPLGAKIRAFTADLEKVGWPRWTAMVAICREVFLASSDAILDAVKGPLEQRYREYREVGLVQGAAYDELAPDRFVVGDVDGVIRELRRYRDEADVDYVVCRFSQPGLDQALADDALRLFGRGVIPEFRMFGFPEPLRLRAL